MDIKILIIEDDKNYSDLLKKRLLSENNENLMIKEVFQSYSLKSGIDLLNRHEIDLIILDLSLPDSLGLDTLNKLNEFTVAVPVIVLTGLIDKKIEISLLKCGAQDYLVKGNFDKNSLMNSICYAIERKNIENIQKKTRDHEIEIGAHIQNTLLKNYIPDNLNEIEISNFTIASKKIDGDFYEILKYSPTCFDVIMGDVMGKGIPAALLGAAIKNQILKEVCQLLAESKKISEQIPNPAKIVTAVNKMLGNKFSKLESFATMFYARFDIESKTVTWVDCGHTPTKHYNSKIDRWSVLKGEDFPLGFDVNYEYADHVLEYELNDLFVVYSDGVTDANNSDGFPYGLKRLDEKIHACRYFSSSKIVEVMKSDLVDFVGNDPPSDDVTFMVIKSKERPLQNTDAKTLSICADKKNICKIRKFIAVNCDENSTNIDADSKYELILAANEVFNNIMVHASPYSDSFAVNLTMEFSGGKVILTLQYQGEYFDGNNRVATLPPTYQENGYGLYIIQEAVDKVQYLKISKQESAIRLEKNL